MKRFRFALAGLAALAAAAVLALLLLGTVGERGGTVEAQPAPLDHFKCYKGSFTPKFQSVSVSLIDQFEGKVTTVISPKFFCNVVSKDGGLIFDPFAHLKCYKIRDAMGQAKFVKLEVLVNNQFGTQTLLVTGPSTLCLPTQKDPLPAPSLALDHYKCYKVRAKTELPLPPTVFLQDQFLATTVKLASVAFLCNPVDKNFEGVINPENHLVCYKIREPKFAPIEIDVNNQFGTEHIKVMSAATLCVPSLKILPNG